MEASIFPVKATVTYSKEDENFPYTISVEDETGSRLRIYLRCEGFRELLEAMASIEKERIDQNPEV